MGKYKFYLERQGFDPVEVIILEKDDKYRVKPIRIGKENYSFNFSGTEKELLEAVNIKLGKYGIKKIEKIE